MYPPTAYIDAGAYATYTVCKNKLGGAIAIFVKSRKIGNSITVTIPKELNVGIEIQ